MRRVLIGMETGIRRGGVGMIDDELTKRVYRETLLGWVSSFGPGRMAGTGVCMMGRGEEFFGLAGLARWCGSCDVGILGFSSVA